MIIAFYPGAGGNRYLQRLLGNDWTQPNTSYDRKTTQLHSHRYLLDHIPPAHSQHILTHCMNSKKIQQTFPSHSVVIIKSNLQASLQREWALQGHKRFLDQLTKNSVSKLEHYRAFRAPNWPNVDSEDQIDQLPKNIRQEVQLDYDQVVANTVCTVPDRLARLTTDTINKINSAYETIMWHQQYYDQLPVDFSQAQQVIDIESHQDEFSQLMQTELCRYQSEIFDQVWSTINEQ